MSDAIKQAALLNEALQWICIITRPVMEDKLALASLRARISDSLNVSALEAMQASAPTDQTVKQPFTVGESVPTEREAFLNFAEKEFPWLNTSYLSNKEGFYFELEEARMLFKTWQEATRQARGQSVPEWISVDERMPAIDTPVLIFLEGEIRIGVRCWENPNHEETFTSFQYWDDPTNDGMDWSDEYITHWMPLPAAPKP